MPASSSCSSCSGSTRPPESRTTRRPTPRRPTCTRSSGAREARHPRQRARPRAGPRGGGGAGRLRRGRDDHDVGRPRPRPRRQGALGARDRRGAPARRRRPRRALGQGRARAAGRGSGDRGRASARRSVRRAVRGAVAERPGRRRARRHELAAPRRPAARAARRPRRPRAARQCRHASRASPRGRLRRDRDRARRTRPTRTMRRGDRRPARDDPRRRPGVAGRDGARGRRGDPRRRRARVGPGGAALPRGRARARPRARGRLPHAGRRARRARRRRARPARVRRRARRRDVGARRALGRRPRGARRGSGRAPARGRGRRGPRAVSRPGTVYLVGAGPGDPGLLTARALELIARADVILHDRLIPLDALRGARDGAEVIDVGKVGGGEQVPQDETTRLLVERALAGRDVVRLKGGDPFVFGRGGEEAQACRAAGVPFEVVPGVTAGVAAPAYAGIPVTQRGMASAVAFVTGHEDPAKPETAIDWPALAAFPGTLVFYMGVRQLPRIASQLAASGRAADEPAAIVERGTLPGQRTVRAPLAEIADAAAAAGVRAPAITLVGPVAALADELAWLAHPPPLGRTVAVTRARAQASGLAARLRELGAAVVEAPAIRVEPLDADVPDPSAYDLLCVTSPNGAHELMRRVRDARALAGPRIAVIGPGTARAMREHGIEPDVVPSRSVAEGLVEALAGVPVQRALIARAEEARDVLPDALRERGAEVDVLALYRTVAETLDDGARTAALGADYATFTSASSVRFFAEAAGGLAGPRLVSIGPATSEELRRHGVEPDVEAEVHTPDGLVEALVRAARA